MTESNDVVFIYFAHIERLIDIERWRISSVAGSVVDADTCRLGPMVSCLAPTLHVRIP